MQIKTQETNFCRQFLQQVVRQQKENKQHHQVVSDLEETAKIIRQAVKFVLPHSGILHNDPELRSLDENEPLHLPFPCIALEYTRGDSSDQFKSGYSPKAIVFALDNDPHELNIKVFFVPWSSYARKWMPMPQIFIPKEGYLDRKNLNLITSIPDTDTKYFNDYMNPLIVLMEFLNVLQCRNVHIEQLPARQKTVHRKHEILPFDSYHILTVNSVSKKSLDHAGHGCRVQDRHSPREHLRRGHIRRLADGRRLWINAMVVAAGNQGGKIHKDYRLNAPPHEHIAP